MRPNDCVNFLGNEQCLKSCTQCVEIRGICCTVYDPVEEERDNNVTRRYF